MEEILSITEEVCSQQSDWTLFWRFRALVLDRLVQQGQKEVETKKEIETEKEVETEMEVETEESDRSVIDMLTRLKRDLNLTFQILVQNPKSYATWAHRRVVLSLMKLVDLDEGQSHAKDRDFLHSVLN